MSKFSFLLSFLFFVFSLPLISSCQTPSDVDDDEKPWEWGNKDDNTVKPGDSFYPKKEGVFRIMTYNVGAFAKFMNNSTNMVADMITEIEADVVGLNELDSCNTRHMVNQVAVLANTLNWQWRFGRAMPYRNGAYGNGVVVPSGVKILDTYTVALPKGSGSEPRSICVVETDKYVIGAAHIDHTNEDAALGQMAVVNEWANKHYKDYDKPVFFCGDMNCVPDSAPIQKLKGAFNLISSGQPTVPVTGPTKCIDYIFLYRGARQVKVVGSSTLLLFNHGNVTKASDHCPVYVDVQF